MKLLQNGIEYIFEIIKFYLAFRWLFGIHEREGKWKYLLVLLGVGGFAAWLVYGNENNFPVYLIFIIVEMEVLFQDKVIKIIFMSFWFSSVIGIFDGISKIIVWVFFDTVGNNSIWVRFLISGITIFTEIIFGKTVLKINRNKIIHMNWKYFFCFFILGWGYSYIMGYMWVILGDRGANTYLYLDIILIGMIMYGTMIMLIALTISRDNYREKEAFNQRLLKMQEEQYNYLKKRERDIRKFRHDMKEHMLIIQKYCETEGNQKLKEYIKEINVQTHMEEKRVTVHNKEVDVILNQYMSQAEELGIQLKIKGQMPADSVVSSYDLCVIFANLLKNGIEAAKNSRQRRIELTVGYKDNVMMIHMKNDYEGKRKKKNGKYLTTKEDMENHGIGMENVRECVEKYHGNLEMEELGEEFLTMIDMNIY
ncbi:MAG: GHKL domain-containing protein [Lachnospiraceae bacterium]|nr:GHKL domain-containing protein [Lachnospiraceae bacterium]